MGCNECTVVHIVVYWLLIPDYTDYADCSYWCKLTIPVYTDC